MLLGSTVVSVVVVDVWICRHGSMRAMMVILVKRSVDFARKGSMNEEELFAKDKGKGKIRRTL